VDDCTRQDHQVDDTKCGRHATFSLPPQRHMSRAGHRKWGDGEQPSLKLVGQGGPSGEHRHEDTHPDHPETDGDPGASSGNRPNGNEEQDGPRRLEDQDDQRQVGFDCRSETSSGDHDHDRGCQHRDQGGSDHTADNGIEWTG